MKVLNYYVESWRRFGDFRGRSSRPAYWWPFLLPFGNLVLLYWLVQPSSVETNEWGASGAQGEITTASSDTEPEPPQQTSDIIR